MPPYAANPNRGKAAPAAGRGFTLIELVAVMVILGILASVAVISYSNVSKSQRARAAGVTLQAVRADIAAQPTDDGAFPGDGALLANLTSKSDVDYLAPVDGSAAPSFGASAVSYRYVNDTVATFAVSAAAGETCLLMAASPTQTDLYANVRSAPAGLCTADILASCLPALRAGSAPVGTTGAGTRDDPWILPDTAPCQPPPDPDPGPPAQCVATTAGREPGTALVAWIVPASSGPAVGYTVTATGDGIAADHTATAGATSLLIAGLTPGVSYTFTVAPTSPPGTAVAAAGALVLPPAAPAVTVTPGTDGSWHLTWQQVQGATSYTVSRSPDFPALPAAITPPADPAAAMIFDDPATSVDPATSYQYTVTAHIAAPQLTQCGQQIPSGGQATSQPVTTP